MTVSAFLAAAVLAAATLPAAAGCTRHDRFGTPDKALHAMGGAVVAMAATLHTGDRWAGFLWGAGVNLVGELADCAGGGTGSAHDAFAGAVGAAIGAQLGGLLLRVERDRVAVVYRRTF